MYCIHLKNNNPYFCLAAEEYLLKNFNEDVFMIWQSDNTIVLGKHQNALGEINYPFVRKNNITVARRISGGGTVFHDSGNVNFAFIKNVNSTAEINFQKFTEPIISALAELGITAYNSGRNDIMVEGKKISGNAEHVYKNRVLHHGTLLFDSDLKNLGKAIKVIPGKYIGKAVQSNRSDVANILDFLERKISVDRFINFLKAQYLTDLSNREIDLNTTDIQKIGLLAEEKFIGWEWNFGYSPAYFFKNTIEFDNRELSIELSVKKGIIQECKVSGGYFSLKEMEILNSKLIGERHFYEDIYDFLRNSNLEVSEELINTFF